MMGLVKSMGPLLVVFLWVVEQSRIIECSGSWVEFEFAGRIIEADRGTFDRHLTIAGACRRSRVWVKTVMRMAS